MISTYDDTLTLSHESRAVALSCMLSHACAYIRILSRTIQDASCLPHPSSSHPIQSLFTVSPLTSSHPIPFPLTRSLLVPYLLNLSHPIPPHFIPSHPITCPSLTFSPYPIPSHPITSLLIPSPIPFLLIPSHHMPITYLLTLSDPFSPYPIPPHPIPPHPIRPHHSHFIPPNHSLSHPRTHFE